MTEIEKYIRPNILALQPYSSARDEFKGTAEIFLDANENPWGTYNRYPDPYQQKLKQKISTLKKVDHINIFIGNGSDEAIDLVFRIFCEPGRDKVLVFTPTYGVYEVMANINQVEVIKVPLNKKFQVDRGKTSRFLKDKNLKIVFICSPNNPTGNLLRKNDIDFILKNFKGIVVVDEAYIDFSAATSYINAIEKYQNLVVLQTFSKAWGLAGVRVGMAFSNSTIISYFNQVKLPYNVSMPNQEMVLNSLKQSGVYRKKIAQILAEKKLLITALKKMQLVETIFPSDANFVLVKMKNANEVYQQLTQRGIIVRNRSREVSNCLRITIGTKKENQRLINTLKKLSDEKKSIVY